MLRLPDTEAADVELYERPVTGQKDGARDDLTLGEDLLAGVARPSVARAAPPSAVIWEPTIGEFGGDEEMNRV